MTRALCLSIITAALLLGADVKEAAGLATGRDHFVAIAFLIVTIIFVGFGF